LGSTIHIIPNPSGCAPSAAMLACYQKLAQAPQSVLWLTPSDSAADVIVRQLAATGKPILSPNVLTIESFEQQLAERAGTSGMGRLQMLEEVVRAHAQRKKNSYFARVAQTRGFIQGCEGLIDELDSVGITPGAFAAACRERGPKLAACAEMYSAIHAHSDAGQSDKFGVSSEIERAFPPSILAVFLSGFTSFTPREWQLVEAIAARAELWIALPKIDDRRPEAFVTVIDTRERLKGIGILTVHDCPAVDRPVGLAHLDRHLFGSAVDPLGDATGLRIIEAPGALGEARQVARHIRSLLAANVRPDAIIVTARVLHHSFDLLSEVFDEYGIPVELDGRAPVLRNSAVATLLRALRLPEDGWPFAGLTALLRSTYFRPVWPGSSPDAARRSESLLRLLGVPRQRDAYLRAIHLWSETPPVGLEDEQAEESRRQRKAKLAAHFRPFLERFFQAWDGLPANAGMHSFAVAMRQFARDIGLETAAADTTADCRALNAFWAGLDSLDGPPISREVFLRRLHMLAADIELPRSSRTAGRVRIMPPEEVRHLTCEYLFVLGLGEKSFPCLTPPESLLDDVDRMQLRAAGLPFPDPNARLGREQLLFLELVGRPQRELILSYAAVDAKGQPLLPGTFLRAVRECFTAGAIVVEHQKMLIEGDLTREPLSAAEARSQFADGIHGAGDGPTGHPDLPRALCQNLQWAREVAAARFHSKDYDRYDGWLNHPVARAAVADRFGSHKVFSPTALEGFVACPFRFFLDQVLRLEELEEPGEEVEHTRRGAAYHRALSRLHLKLSAADPQMTRTPLPDRIGTELRNEIDVAVQEYAQRAPSPAARKLWELEGKRLHRSATKYADHWEGFLDPWRKAGAALDPRLLEADFGLPAAGAQVQGAVVAESREPLVLTIGDVEVRIGGRIDRVDIAELKGELGFWIIDYKTGRAASYTAAELARFEKLQLPLYALAVERVFFPGRKARPLGLAYWLVTDTGPKTVSHNARQALGWLNDPKKWSAFRKQLEEWVATVVGRIRDGHFPLAPRSDHCTQTCSFGHVCRISQSRNVGKTWDLPLPGADKKSQ
jgi:ATP-dependent helicase/nuclease subunit B